MRTRIDSVDDPVECLRDPQELFPATVTVTRTSESDFKSRQLIVWIDGLRVATLLWGDHAPEPATGPLVTAVPIEP